MTLKTNEYFYHITAKTIKDQWLEADMPKVWNAACQSLSLAAHECEVLISQFVLMSNHYHLTLRTPKSNIDYFMFLYTDYFNFLLEKDSFNHKFHWSLIKNSKQFQQVFTYIYQNPVSAKIAFKSHDYLYSTYHYTYNHLKLPFPLCRLKHFENNLQESKYDLFLSQVDERIAIEHI